MVGRVERWRLVLFVVVLCAVRCASHETLCSAIKDARSCLESEKEGPRCKWCAPKKRAENNGFCIDISAPAGLCKTTETALTQLQLRKEVPGDIFEFDDVHFRSTGSHTPTHFTSESLRMTEGEINEKLVVLGLPLQPNVENAFTLDVTNFFSHFASNEYVLGEVSRTLQRILQTKLSFPEDDDVKAEFPLDGPDIDKFGRALKDQLLAHLKSLTGVEEIHTAIKIAKLAIGVKGFVKNFLAPVHATAVLEVNQRSYATGAGRDFTYSDIWHAYVMLLNLIPKPGQLEKFEQHAKTTMERKRPISETYAANQHVVAKSVKAALHSFVGFLTGGVSAILTISADAAGSIALFHEHQLNVESRALLMIHTLYLRERLCLEKLARAEHPSLPPPTHSDGTTSAQAEGGNAPDVPSASTAGSLNDLAVLWTRALEHVKKCDILEPNPCPFGFYCRRDQLFRRTEDGVLLLNPEWNTVGYCSPVTFPQFELGEECQLHSDCLSGICALSLTEPKKPICLRASEVDLGNCQEIGKMKIITNGGTATHEAFSKEEVRNVKKKYRDAQKAFIARQQEFDMARKQLIAERRTHQTDTHYLEGERLDAWLAAFASSDASDLPKTSHLKQYDPWFQQPPEQVETSMEEGKEPSTRAPQVATTKATKSTTQQVPKAKTGLLKGLVSGLVGFFRRPKGMTQQGSKSKADRSGKHGQVPLELPQGEIKSIKVTPFQKAARAYKILNAAKKPLFDAQAELRKTLYYQCEVHHDLPRGENEEWKSVKLVLPAARSGDTLDVIYTKHNEQLIDKRTSEVHKLILINHLLGHIVRPGLTETDHAVIQWMLMTCFKPDPKLAEHGLRNKLQIRVAQTIAKVIPCKETYIEWLRHAGFWLRDMEDPVVNCPSLAFQLLVASGRC